MTDLWNQIDLKTHGIIEASAGTGKTTTVVELALRILAEPQASGEYPGLDRLLIVTYTEKAAGELRDKIRRRLEEKIAALSKAPDADPHLIEHLTNCLIHFEGTGIDTIHAFCRGLLRDYPVQTGEPFEVEMENGAQTARAIARAQLRDLWKSPEKRAWFFPDQEKNGLSFPKSAASWVESLADLTSNYSPDNGDSLEPRLRTPEEITALEKELTNALQELRGILGTGFRPDKDHPFINAYDEARKTLGLKHHKFTANKKSLLIPLLELLDQCGKITFEDGCIPLAAKLLNTVKPESFWKAVNGLGPERHEVLAAWKSRLDFDPSTVLAMADFCKNKAAQWMEAAESAPRHREIYRAVTDCQAKLEKQKRDRSSMEYIDMITRVFRALSDPRQELLPLLRQRYAYGIIDEFQDTNQIQWEIFEKIFLSDSPEIRRLYLIGDPKQSIFSFQSTDLPTYRKACGILKEQGAVPYRLDINFRSSPKMVRAYNLVFSHPAWFGMPSKNLDTYLPVKAVEKSEDQAESAPIVLMDCSRETGVAGKGRKVARWIAGEIERLTQPPASHSYGDIAVLVQKNAEAVPVCRELGMRGIPYLRYKESGLFSMEESLDLIILLEALLNPSDGTRVKKALLTRYFDFNPDEFLDPKTQRLFNPELFREWSGLIHRRRWPQFFRELHETTALPYRLRLYADGDRKMNILRQTSAYVTRCGAEENLSLFEIIQRLRGLRDGKLASGEDVDRLQKESDKHAVQIMTIHSSKGLDFPVVFLAGGGGQSRGGGPYLSHSKEEGGRAFWIDANHGPAKKAKAVQEIEEWKRLYYVALTRAKVKMYLPLFHDVRQGNKGRTPSEQFLSAALWNAYQRCRPETHLLAMGDEFSPSQTPRKSQNGQSPFNAMCHVLRNLGPEDLDSTSDKTLYVEHRRREQTSYTAIVHQNPMTYTLEGRVNLEDGRAEAIMPEEAPAPDYNLPRGAAAGTDLHDILENISFDTVGRAASPAALLQNSECAALIAESLKRGGLAPSWSGEAAQMVWKTLHTRLPDPARKGRTLQLHTILEKKSEMEFHFTFDKQGRLFGSKNLGGYVLGYIDLIFEFGGYYYIVDWKSNSLSAYDGESIWQNMEREQYTTQSLLYCVAVHRWLQNILPDYSYEKNFGGIYYLYLRGIQPGTDLGINSYRPGSLEMEKNFPGEIQKLIRSSHRASVGTAA